MTHSKEQLQALYFEECLGTYVCAAINREADYWTAYVLQNGIEQYSCGFFESAKEAFFCAKASLAYFKTFGSWDYMGCHDNREGNNE